MKKTDKELAAERMRRIKAMNDNWADDNEVVRLFDQLIIEESNVRVLWPTSMRGEATAISYEDISLLAYFMSSEGVNTVVIPQNTGNHWFPVVLTKDARGLWSAHEITTGEDNKGDCGRHTVSRATAVVREGLASYSKNHPRLVHSLNSEDRQQIQPVLHMMNSHLVPTPKPTFSKREDADIEEALRLNRIMCTGIETELTELGDASYTGQKERADRAFQNLENLLSKLEGPEHNRAISRLKSIHGGLKPDIAKLIKKFEPKAQLSQNRCAMLNQTQAKTQTPVSAPTPFGIRVSATRG